MLQSRIARELHLKRTPQLAFHYDETIDQAMRLEELISREQEPPVEAQPGMTDIALDTDLDPVVAALAAADRVLIATHENPDGDAIRSMTAAAAAHTRSSAGGAHLPRARVDHPARGRLPGPAALERHIDPATLDGWALLALDCGNDRRLGRGTPICWRAARPSSTSTITMTTAASVP